MSEPPAPLNATTSEVNLTVEPTNEISTISQKEESHELPQSVINTQIQPQVQAHPTDQNVAQIPPSQSLGTLTGSLKLGDRWFKSQFEVSSFVYVCFFNDDCMETVFLTYTKAPTNAQ